MEPASPFPMQQEAMSLHLWPAGPGTGLPVGEGPHLTSCWDPGTSCPAPGGTSVWASPPPLRLIAGQLPGRSVGPSEGRSGGDAPLPFLPPTQTLRQVLTWMTEEGKPQRSQGSRVQTLAPIIMSCLALESFEYRFPHP